MPVDQDLPTTVECPHCGRSVTGGRFCTHCGQPLGGEHPDGADRTVASREAHRSPEAPPAADRGRVAADGPATASVVACVRCGGVNAVSRQRCGRCGGDLSGAASPADDRRAGALAAPAGQAPRGHAGSDDPGHDDAGNDHPRHDHPRHDHPRHDDARHGDRDDGPGLPGVLVILTVILLAVSAAVALTLLSARGVGPFAGPEAGQPSVSGAARAQISAVRASSTLPPEADISYGADNLIDGDPSTAWNEGEPGDGEGEWVEVELARPTVVTSVIVWNGYQAGDFFARHNRVRRLQLELDGRTFAVRLLDRRGAQAITLPERVATQRIRLTVAGTFPGTVYNDTALSELTVRGVPQDPSVGRSSDQSVDGAG